MLIQLLKKIFLLFLILFNSFAFAKVKEKQNLSCDLYFSRTQICGKIYWIHPPKSAELITTKNEAVLQLTLVSKESSNHKIPAELSVQVEPYMPSMGHGSYPTKTFELSRKKSEAIYRVNQIFLTMPGAWELRVELTRNGIKLDHSKFNYTLK